jgi:hypothetical protein
MLFQVFGCLFLVGSQQDGIATTFERTSQGACEGGIVLDDQKQAISRHVAFPIFLLCQPVLRRVGAGHRRTRRRK